MTLFDLKRKFKSPVKIDSLQLLRNEGDFFVRAASEEGAIGVAATNDRIKYLYPILHELVIPYFVGKDACDLESLVDGVYLSRSNYKLAGLALWNCVAYVEYALWDMLGKIAGKSVGELMGGVLRKEVPVYLSSLRRDTTPEQEVELLGKRLSETGSKAVKLKIGGRMSRNADAAPGRSKKLVALARKTFKQDITIYVDANGSYDAAQAIEVGKMLEEQGVAFLEEPCPFEDFEATQRVAEALRLPVAGGEQDTSIEKFRWYLDHKGLDILQPDVTYNGGFIRTARVARLAAKSNLSITPHSPSYGLRESYTIHFASGISNVGPFIEYKAEPGKAEAWYSPSFEVKNGLVQVPTGPGLGITIDPDFIKKAHEVDC